MKKSDLRSGMIVEFRNGVQDIVMLNPDCEGREFIALHGVGYMPFSNYDDNFCRTSGNRDWDIVKIYSLDGNISHLFDDKENTLKSKRIIWERKEVTEMTIAEIEEKLGIKNLKIIKE